MVHLETIAALAFAPGLFWLWYFYRRDVFEPEPAWLIARTFLLGMLITLPVGVVEGLVSLAGLSDVYLVVVAAPVIEELGKFAVVFFTVYHDREFDEPIDGIEYAAAAALGFASLENARYVVLAYLSSPLEAIDTFAFRAFFSVPAHALISSVWGYALGRAKFSGPSGSTALIFWGLAIAIMLHGVFNLLAQLQMWIALLALILLLVPLMWVLLNRNILLALKFSRFR
ncbi:MAG: PrsW family glutamic-type intramembrane protease [Methanomicrobiales archaeon]|nr:PrsW family glutamic-type intramembrane protease [Methanomicrobiales archaeon]